MSQAMDFIDMPAEEPEHDASDFLRKFLARWQNYDPQQVETQHQEDRLIFHQIMQALTRITEADDLQPIFTYILDIGLEQLPAEKAALLLRHEDGKMHMAVSRGAFATDEPIVADDAFIRRVLRTKESLCLSEAHDATSQTLLEDNFRWFIPIRNAQQLLGILYLEGKERHNTPEKFTIGQLLAELLATAIGKAYLVQQNMRTWKFIEIMRQKVIHKDQLVLRGKIAAPVANELNKLLTIISGNLSLLKSKLACASLNSEILQNIDSLIEALVSADRMTQALCSAVNGEPVMTRCSLNAIIELFISIAHPLYQQQLLNFIPILDATIPDVYVDAGQIRQVIFNLVNTIVETKKPLTITFRTFYNSEEGRVKLKIKVDGSKMTQEKFDALFAGMAIIHRNDREWGLRICREIIEKHHGAISVECSPNQGIEFTLSLPSFRAGI